MGGCGTTTKKLKAPAIHLLSAGLPNQFWSYESAQDRKLNAALLPVEPCLITRGTCTNHQDFHPDVLGLCVTAPSTFFLSPAHQIEIIRSGDK